LFFLEEKVTIASLSLTPKKKKKGKGQGIKEGKNGEKDRKKKMLPVMDNTF
jgi:hypothetical protein